MLDDDLLTRPLRPPAGPDGRRLLTLDDLFAMMQAGVIDEGERSELIDGELFVMPSEGELHVDFLDAFTDTLTASLGDRFRVRQRGVFNRPPLTQLSPDVALWPLAARFWDLTGPNAALVVEISDTTAGTDKRQKAPLYARAGLRELWIMDVRERELLVYRHAQGDVWPRPTPYRPGQRVQPLCAPDIGIVVPG